MLRALIDWILSILLLMKSLLSLVVSYVRDHRNVNTLWRGFTALSTPQLVKEMTSLDNDQMAKNQKMVATNNKNPKVFVTELNIDDKTAVSPLLVESLQIIKSNNDNKSLFTNVNRAVKHLFVMMTGNPGICQIYEPFCTTLHSKLMTSMQISDEKSDEIAVVAVGFTAHSISNHVNQFYSLSSENTKSTFTIDEQIEHKRLLIMDLIQKYPNAKIHLMGHSVGSYVITNLIQQMPSPDFIEKHFGLFFLLYPTIQNMIHTPNAQTYKYFVTPVMRQIVSLGVSFLFGYSPRFLREKFLHIYANKPENKGSKILADSLHLFMQYPLLVNVLTLANSEFEQIQDIDNVMSDHLPNTHMLYRKCRWMTCDGDGWCPQEHIRLIEQKLTHHNETQDQILWTTNKQKSLVFHHYPEGHHAFCLHERDVQGTADFIAENMSSGEKH